MGFENSPNENDLNHEDMEVPSIVMGLAEKFVSKENLSSEDYKILANYFELRAKTGVIKNVAREEASSSANKIPNRNDGNIPTDGSETIN